MTAGKAPNANTPAHEAITANNPSKEDNTGMPGYATPKDSPLAQGMLDAYQEGLSFFGTPGAAAKTAAAAGMTWGASHASSIRGWAASAWGAFKGKLGFGPKNTEEAAKAAALHTKETVKAEAAAARVSIKGPNGALTQAEYAQVQDVFAGKAELSTLSAKTREAAAQAYESAAKSPGAGDHALGRAFNGARAGFMRGKGENPGTNALDFGKANGIVGPGKADKGLSAASNAEKAD